MHYKLTKAIQSLESYKDKIELKIINLSNKLFEFPHYQTQIDILEEELVVINEALEVLYPYE